MTWTLRSWAALCAVTAAACGCGGSDGPPRYEVSGAVTYDGRPVPKGMRRPRRRVRHLREVAGVLI